jgi:serine phosphatase RsbU (regulator of sigma subunit)
MLNLRIVPADGPPFDHWADGTSLTIGRSTKCDLTIPDRSLSRTHARLLQVDGQWMVEDLDSRNGTRVNGAIVSSPTPVGPGDVISLSASVVTIRQTQAAGDETTETPKSAGSDTVVYRPASDVVAESRVEISTPFTMEQPERLRAAEHLRALYDIHHAFDSAMTADALLDGVLERIFKHLRPDHGAVFLTDGDALVRAACRSVLPEPDTFPESKSLAREVIDKGLVALVHDTTTDGRFATSESLFGAGVRTLVAAPLLTPTGSIGMIVLSSGLAERRFSNADVELLAVVASATGLRLRNLALAEEAAERRRLEQEVVLARRIQVALLPAAMPQVRGFEIHGCNIPSRGVSGDYYQIVERPLRGELAVVVADVSGKGIAASLLTGYVDALINALIGENMDPAEIFNRMSPQMNRKTPVESFATVILGILSSDTGVLRFASAGHDPSILVRGDGEVELLMPTGIPLGMMPDATYFASETRLEEGDTLILYTDGITEAENPDGEMFGRERLIEICRAHRTMVPESLSTAIHAELDAFVAGCQYCDDRTLVIVRRSTW